MPIDVPELAVLPMLLDGNLGRVRASSAPPAGAASSAASASASAAARVSAAAGGVVGRVVGATVAALPAPARVLALDDTNLMLAVLPGAEGARVDARHRGRADGSHQAEFHAHMASARALDKALADAASGARAVHAVAGMAAAGADIDAPEADAAMDDCAGEPVVTSGAASAGPARVPQLRHGDGPVASAILNASASSAEQPEAAGAADGHWACRRRWRAERCCWRWRRLFAGRCPSAGKAANSRRNRASTCDGHKASEEACHQAGYVDRLRCGDLAFGCRSTLSATRPPAAAGLFA
jgi:hypothetical protein